MAVALPGTPATSTDANNAGAGVSYTVDSGAQRLFLCMFGEQGGLANGGLASCTFNSIGMTLGTPNFTENTVANFAAACYAYSKEASIISGAQTLLPTKASTTLNAWLTGMMITLTGVDQTNPYRSAPELINTGAAGSTSTSMTSAGLSVVSGDMVVTFAVTGSTNPAQAAGGYTYLTAGISHGGSGATRGAYKAITVTGTETPQWTFASDNGAMISFVVKAAGGITPQLMGQICL